MHCTVVIASKWACFKTSAQMVASLTVISEYVGLRAKCYSSKTYSTKKREFESKKKCKGIRQCLVMKRLSFNDYKNCLMNYKAQKVHGVYFFRSKRRVQHTGIMQF